MTNELGIREKNLIGPFYLIVAIYIFLVMSRITSKSTAFISSRNVAVIAVLTLVKKDASSSTSRNWNSSSFYLSLIIDFNKFVEESGNHRQITSLNCPFLLWCTNMYDFAGQFCRNRIQLNYLQEKLLKSTYPFYSTLLPIWPV